jgi:hypothetical protein
MGWIAVRTCPVLRAGNFRLGLGGRGREAMVKVCGVTMARPQGQSRVPNPLTGWQ